MKARIVGAGAIGAVVARKIYRHADTALIVDEERLSRYSEGLIVNGERIMFPLMTPSEADTADLIIFAVKNTQLDAAIAEALPFAGPDTSILPLLNGIEAEEKLGEAFGAEKVLYAFITDISSVHEGNSTTCFSDSGTIVFGERDNRLLPLSQDKHEFLSYNLMEEVIPKDIKIDLNGDDRLERAFEAFNTKMLYGNYFSKAIDNLEKELETA